MRYVYVLLPLLLACSSDHGTNPGTKEGTNLLAGRAFESTRAFDGNAFDRQGNVIRIADRYRWSFADSTYLFSIVVESFEPVTADLTFDWSKPRLEYVGRYWLDMVGPRRGILHLERTGGHFHSRVNADETLEVLPGNVELPVLFGRDVITLSETDYREVR